MNENKINVMCNNDICYFRLDGYNYANSFADQKHRIESLDK